MTKYRKGQCVDLASITESGEEFWNNGWHIKKAFPNYYRLEHPVSGAITWSIDRGLRSSKKCGKISSDPRR